ncbi:MAG: 3-keto-5-aminohexanoate cleavage protein [Pseudomonadales bacterium]|nr:3-keto-5-aminohexanoate cleavage protein [Pseudomonadales bacterium]
MKSKVWIEVALNGAWPRALQPNVPVTAEEIIKEGIACVNAGAAIVHAHTLDPATGKQDADSSNCEAFISGIRSSVDAIVYPTAIPQPMPESALDRFATTNDLCERGLLEWGVLDPGSCNFSRVKPSPHSQGSIYDNSPSSLKEAAKMAANIGWRPAYACYEPGFVREGAMLHRTIPDLQTPIYRFMLSDGFTFGFPPREWAVEALAKLMAEEAPGAPWMVAGLDVDTIPLIPKIVELGGHVRVGLEDAPFRSEKTNLQLVEEAVKVVREVGGEPATAEEVRLSF